MYYLIREAIFTASFVRGFRLIRNMKNAKLGNGIRDPQIASHYQTEYQETIYFRALKLLIKSETKTKKKSKSNINFFHFDVFYFCQVEISKYQKKHFKI